MQNEDFEVEGLDVESFDVEGLGEYEELRVLDRAEPIAYVARHDRHRLTADQIRSKYPALSTPPPIPEPLAPSPAHGSISITVWLQRSPDRRRGIILPIWTWTLIGRLLIATIIGLVIFGV